MILYTLTDPQLDPVMARTLSRSKTTEVRRTIATNPNTPADALLSLIAEFPGEVLQNPSLPLLLLEDPELLHKIKEENGEKLGQILFHECFPRELQEDIFLFKLRIYIWNIQGLLRHPGCPKRLLVMGLRSTENVYSKQNLLLALVHHEETIEEDLVTYHHVPLDTNTRVALAMCKVAPGSLLEGLLSDGNEQVRAQAAMNPKSPRERLCFLRRAGASDDLRRFSTPGILTPKELLTLRGMGPFGEALWVRHPGTSSREAIFRHDALWLTALTTRPDLSAEAWAQIKVWAHSRRRKITQLKEEIRARNKAETQKKNQKKGKVSIRPSWH